MGKLADALALRNNTTQPSGNNDINVNVRLDSGNNEEEARQPYDAKWLDKVVVHHRYAVSNDEFKVAKILKALDRRDGQCPCGGVGQQFKCPCNIMREANICKCGLFQSVSDRKVHGSTTSARIN